MQTRWQKNKDLNWAWSKSKLDLKAANDSERKMAKARDADLMAQMLYVPNYTELTKAHTPHLASSE
jgi:hypothetical protein